MRLQIRQLAFWIFAAALATSVRAEVGIDYEAGVEGNAGGGDFAPHYIMSGRGGTLTQRYGAQTHVAAWHTMDTTCRLSWGAGVELWAGYQSSTTYARYNEQGVLTDNMTNPRLVLNSTPVAIEDAELPALTLFKYDLSNDYLGALGHEVGQAEGYFRYVNGAPCLCSDDDSVMVKLNFDFAPQLQEAMTPDVCRYGLLCVFSLDEPWEENLINAPMRRISATGEDYYTNYTIYPLAILYSAAVDEVTGNKQVVDVKYVSPAGVVDNTPHDGVNIVVTTYGDGSRTTVKRFGAKNK